MDEANSRRQFLKRSIAALWMVACRPALAGIDSSNFKGAAVFQRIVDKAKQHRWGNLPIGELVGKIGAELVGTPYRAHTLELSPNKEVCSVDLTGLDCVTFFETCLAFARMLKRGKSTPADLLGEVEFMRYRNGVAGDFSTRLHYTSDWLLDNSKKHVVKLLDDLPGSEPFEPKVGFMSEHPQSYQQLVAHPELIEKIRRDENALNSQHSLRYVPLDKIAGAEAMLETGDIVGICTDLKGLDILHTGLIFKGKSGVAHFMNASSLKQNNKVVIDPGPLSRSLNWSKHLTGAIFARPLEPQHI